MTSNKKLKMDDLEITVMPAASSSVIYPWGAIAIATIIIIKTV